MLRAKRKNEPRDYEHAKRLRHQSSPSEQQLWKELQKLGGSAGIKFRRQQPLSPYIADFACMEAKLIIELDGPSHDARQDHDRKRSEYLQKLGYTILRFSNQELAANKEGIIITIAQKVRELVENAG